MSGIEAGIMTALEVNGCCPFGHHPSRKVIFSINKAWKQEGIPYHVEVVGGCYVTEKNEQEGN